MAKAPFHFASGDGSSLALALKLQRDGHPVTLSIKEKEAQDAGRGLIDFAKEPPRGAVVVFDATKRGAEGAALRRRGFAVIGGNPYDEPLECDRPAGVKIMHAAGIKTPDTFPFREAQAAIKFIERQRGRWFVKVSGSPVESSTFDAPDPDAMCRYLAYVGRSGKIEGLEMQRAIEGTEVSLNGWFDGQKFVPPYDVTLEEKKFLAGDKGPRTGCESCVVWHGGSDLAEKTVEKITSQLRREGYVGPVDLNSLVNAKGEPYGLEWTARLGFDATQAWMRLFGDDLGEQLEAFAHGELDAWEPAGKGEFSSVLRISMPPYPTWDPKIVAQCKGIPLPLAVLADPRVDIMDVMQGEDGPECAGGSGFVCTVAARSDTLEDLPHALLDAANSLTIPNAQYRIDPLRRVPRDYAELERLELV